MENYTSPRLDYGRLTAYGIYKQRRHYNTVHNDLYGQLDVDDGREVLSRETLIVLGAWAKELIGTFQAGTH
jgi:hypothetical protein